MSGRLLPRHDQLACFISIRLEMAPGYLFCGHLEANQPSNLEENLKMVLLGKVREWCSALLHFDDIGQLNYRQ